VNKALLVPAFAPLTFHWYTGDVPPLTAMAVYDTWLPEQTVVEVAEIEMPAVSNGFTVMTTAFDVAGLPLGHVAAEVSTQVTELPCDGAKV
jgi:hypothetical protein